jgi:mycofactocin system creatininase family protein
VTRELADARFPSLPKQAMVLVPVGSLEQHGPHLPLDTDTYIAQSVTRRVADLLEDPNILVAPPITYGASGEHQTFPGTSSIGNDALHRVLVELTRSLRTWCARVVFVNAHGGNAGSIVGAVRQMIAEGHDVAWVPCAAAGEVDGHAGFTETSLMLHLRPRAVRRDLAEAGNTMPLEQLLPVLVEQGVAAVSPNGVLGDPDGASARAGRQMFQRMTHDIAVAVRDGDPDPQGCLRVSEPSP